MSAIQNACERNPAEQFIERLNCLETSPVFTYIRREAIQESTLSKESATAFLRQVAEDDNLRQGLVEFAAQHGFEFTSGELHEAQLDAAGAFSSISKRRPDKPPDGLLGI